MTKRPAETFHPLAITNSLQRQNAAANLFCATVDMAAHLLQNEKITKITELGKQLADASAEFRAVMWPEKAP